MSRAALVVGVLFALAPLWMLPVGLVLYGGGAGALGGLFLIGGLIAVQWPVFVLLQRAGFVPRAKSRCERTDLTGRRNDRNDRQA